MRISILATLGLCLFLTACATPAFAARQAVITCTDRHCSDWSAKPQRHATVKRVRHKAVVQRRHRTITTYARRPVDNSLRRSSRGLVEPLKAKAEAILASCPGAYIMSAVRHTRVRGSGRISLHASGRAVDMAGNPRCIYAQLQGWPGGYSVDYARVKHVHISYSPDGREWGARFAHWQPRRARHVRLAHAR